MFVVFQNRIDVDSRSKKFLALFCNFFLRASTGGRVAVTGHALQGGARVGRRHVLGGDRRHAVPVHGRLQQTGGQTLACS